MNRSTAEITTGALSTVALPLLLMRAIIDSNWARALPERLGFGDWSGEDAADGRQRVWFHAASVGEVGGIAPVVKRFTERYPRYSPLVTTTSLTGRAEVTRRELVSSAHLLPLDHPVLVRRLLRRIRPKLMVIAETEIWPSLLFALDREAIPVLLVNGRISDRAFERYLRFRSLFEPVFGLLQRVLVQTELDRERFVTLGVERARVRVVGSTKYDQLSSTDLLPQRELLARDFGLDATRPVFVAGSVRSGEIEIVVNAYLRAREKVPSLQLILAPRHPERFESAAFALSQIGLPFAKRSDGRPRELSAVLLLDTFGELRAAYALGSVAFVGGTLVDIGGHNLLEPAVFRVPVTFGRYTQNMKEIAAGLKASGGAIEVQNGEELAEIIAALAIDVERRARVGERAHQVWQRNVGATDIVCDEIATLIGMPGAAEGVAREAQVRP